MYINVMTIVEFHSEASEIQQRFELTKYFFDILWTMYLIEGYQKGLFLVYGANFQGKELIVPS